MAIELYQHNEIAYNSAVSMLADTGKAAIIHPTGTGKSFIGFKLCEDNPSKTVCWLSPSEYIFKTQIENLKESSDYKPENIKFITYAKLMLMSQEDIKAISPQYIILDEFHRCGAEMWGQGTARLLNAYPQVPILGLSATNIRYLDNQRDMADELFDGNIASEMTLGEAIVRGILNPPKYIQSIYSYKNDLEKYEHRVQSAKNKAVRDAGNSHLEAIRRAIDKADGLDVLFDKHITDRTGKYIVFCANKEHMDEMKLQVKNWFHKIDKNPHVYTVYTEDPFASKSFVDFKEDKDTSHLRLLYAIDALNEGIHIDDINGVILLRPTVSPIIYKQQIGRALATGKNQTPIIFDIVNNIESLYSIGSIQEEMRVAVTYYQYFGDSKTIINENFDIFDEVRNCKELFEQLEDTLSASWDLMYVEASKYFRENKNLEVPKRYKTAEGYSLGSWIQTQRKVRAGTCFGSLNAERVAKLNAIGMRWESAVDIAWDKYYTSAIRYVDKFGNFNVPAKFVDEQGVALGAWITNIRTRYHSGTTTGFLTEERIELLNDLGMIWSQADFIWARNYSIACKYYRENGNLDVSYSYIKDGVKLGVWIQGLRQAYRGMANRAKLTDSQIKMLNEIGMRWDDKYTFMWENGYSEAKKYFEENGNLNVPGTYISATNFKLGDWISNQRESMRNGKLKPERKERLNKIGMIWEASHTDSWNVRYELAKKFFELNGHLEVPHNYIEDGIWLNKWLNDQRQIFHNQVNNKALTNKQITKLEAIGMDWRSYSERVWDRQFFRIRQWIDANKGISVFEQNEFKKWFNDQRKKYQKNQLNAEQVEKLCEIGFVLRAQSITHS